MRRRSLFLLVALLGALLPVTAAGAGAGPTTEVHILHGLGSIPGDDPVDVYLGDTDATEWGLAIADVGFAEFDNLGFFDASSGINVLLCEAAAAPLDTITGCADNATPSVNGNFGTNIDLPAVPSVTLVAAYNGGPGDPGRPTVTPFENDVTCVDPGQGRLSIANAGMAGEGDVLVDGTVEGTIDYGDQLLSELPEGTYDVTLDADEQVDSPNTPVTELVSTTIFAVGNPQFDAPFQFISTELTVPECQQPTTTTTSTTVAPTTTLAPRTPVARPVTASPSFTG